MSLNTFCCWFFLVVVVVVVVFCRSDQCTSKILPIALVLVQKDITHSAEFLQPSISAE